MLRLTTFLLLKVLCFSACCSYHSVHLPAIVCSRQKKWAVELWTSRLLLCIYVFTPEPDTGACDRVTSSPCQKKPNHVSHISMKKNPLSASVRVLPWFPAGTLTTITMLVSSHLHETSSFCANPARGHLCGFALLSTLEGCEQAPADRICLWVLTSPLPFAERARERLQPGLHVPPALCGREGLQHQHVGHAALPGESPTELVMLPGPSASPSE